MGSMGMIILNCYLQDEQFFWFVITITLTMIKHRIYFSHNIVLLHTGKLTLES